MIRINPRKILAQEEARKSPSPIHSEEKVANSESNTHGSETQPRPDPDLVADETDKLVKALWEEFGQLKRNRAKLSSRTAYLVDEVIEKLTKESPTLIEIFLKGEYGCDELKDHYAALQAFIDKGIVLYDNIQHVEQHGTLPVVNGHRVESDDEKVIHHEIRRLDDLIYKTNKKINAKPISGKKSSRLSEWKEKVALAEAKREDLKQKLKRLQYDARAKRTSTE